jgi:hypothetical protein
MRRERPPRGGWLDSSQRPRGSSGSPCAAADVDVRARVLASRGEHRAGGTAAAGAGCGAEPLVSRGVRKVWVRPPPAIPVSRHSCREPPESRGSSHSPRSRERRAISRSGPSRISGASQHEELPEWPQPSESNRRYRPSAVPRRDDVTGCVAAVAAGGLRRPCSRSLPPCSRSARR